MFERFFREPKLSHAVCHKGPLHGRTFQSTKHRINYENGEYVRTNRFVGHHQIYMWQTDQARQEQEQEETQRDNEHIDD